MGKCVEVFIKHDLYIYMYMYMYVCMYFNSVFYRSYPLGASQQLEISIFLEKLSHSFLVVIDPHLVHAVFKI